MDYAEQDAWYEGRVAEVPYECTTCRWVAWTALSNPQCLGPEDSPHSAAAMERVDERDCNHRDCYPKLVLQ